MTLQLIIAGIAGLTARKTAEWQLSTRGHETSLFPTKASRAVFSIACACFYAFASIEASNAGMSGIWSTAGLWLATTMTICDLEARIIPRETCWALAATGLAYASAAGSENMVGAIAILFFMSAAALIASRLTRDIGGGDLRAFPATAVYLYAAGSMWTCLAAASAIYAAVIGMSVATGKLKMKDEVPFAPFFALWITLGVIQTLLQ